MAPLGANPLRHFEGKQTAQDMSREKAIHKVLEYRMNKAAKWEPEYEMYPLRFGPVVVGVCSALTSLPILRHYRRFLNLKNKGLMTSVLAALVSPSIAVAGIHHLAVMAPIMSERIVCPVCYQIRAAVIQLVGGVAFPLLSCSSLSFFLAINYKTEAVPYIKYYKEVWKMYSRMNKNILNKLWLSAAFSIVVALTLTTLEFHCTQKIKENEADGSVRDRPQVVLIKQHDQLESSGLPV